MVRRFAWQFAVSVAGSIAAIAAIGRLGRDWETRVEVRGHSMEPTLFEGDWLLVDANAYVRRAPHVGELVVARDPRAVDRVIVKRVAAVTDGLVVASDHPAHVEDRIGPVASADLIGRPWFRYWPSERFGRVQ